MVRLHYIDNLRWMCILVLFPFHAALTVLWYGYYISSDYTSAAAHGLTVSVLALDHAAALLYCR